jgi:hypothetical protein
MATHASRVGGEEHAKTTDPADARMLIDQLLEAAPVQDPQRVCRDQHPLDLLGWESGGDIEDRSRGSRARDVGAGGAVAGRDPPPADDDSVSSSTAIARHANLWDCRSFRRHPMQHRRR